MIYSFDYFNRYNKPSMTLCNPTGTELESLDVATDVNVSLVYNGLSEISFSIPEKIGGVSIPAYPLCISKRLIKVEGVGVFVLSKPEEINDGSVRVKKIRGYSRESELVTKKLNVFGGTFKFYDPISPNETLIGTILSKIPSWSIGTIDSSLWNKYRTFDVANSTIYAFLMNDAASAYRCIFTFDTVNKTISATAYDNATSETDIFISFDNLLKTTGITENSDEITTALSVYGAGSLDIRTVNPLGTNLIYDFSYYKTLEWMSQDLITALDAWELLVNNNQATYANKLSSLKTYNGILIVQEGELANLNAEYLALEGVQKVRIESGLPYADITVQMQAKQLQINSKESEIVSTESTISTLRQELVNINNLLSFENNFTPTQLEQLSSYTFENTYQNENIIQTDSMSPVEIQEQAQILYDQSKEVLAKISEPKYEFNLDVVNFTALSNFNSFTSQLELGSIASIEIAEGQIVETVLLQININYDNPDGFSLVYSNKLRLNNAGFIYSDLFGQVVKTGSQVSFDNLKWANWENSYKDDVTSFITSALDTTRNALINSTNEEIIINQNGLKGRILDPNTGQYLGNQVWLTSNVLAFTDNSWNTAKAALGNIIVNGVNKYGLIADVVIGRLLAGNNLTIANESNNFILDNTGAYLNNAYFQITGNGGKNKIFLDPNLGIKIQSNIAGTWQDKFYADSSGNIVFAGTLSGANGNFSGTVSATAGLIGSLVIDATGLKTNDGNNYMRGNGDFKWGALSIIGGVATFNGIIYADKVVGQIDTGQIAEGAVGTPQLGNVSAEKITSGTMSGGRIYGGTISGPGFSMSLGGTGVPRLTASAGYEMWAGGGSMTVGSAGGIYAPTVIQLETAGVLRLYCGTLQVNGNNGSTQDVNVGPAWTNKRLKFRYGLFVGFDFL